MKLDLSISIVAIGKQFVAVTKIGGFTVRGRRAETEVLAVRNLFFALQEDDKYSSDDDAMLGIELALTGNSIETALIDAGKTS